MNVQVSSMTLYQHGNCMHTLICTCTPNSNNHVAMVIKSQRRAVIAITCDSESQWKPCQTGSTPLCPSNYVCLLSLFRTIIPSYWLLDKNIMHRYVTPAHVATHILGALTQWPGWKAIGCYKNMCTNFVKSRVVCHTLQRFTECIPELSNEVIPSPSPNYICYHGNRIPPPPPWRCYGKALQCSMGMYVAMKTTSDF